MLKAVQFKIDIQIGPMQMRSVGYFNLVNLGNFRVFKPGIVFVRQKVFSFVYKDPNAILGNILDFNARFHY